MSKRFLLALGVFFSLNIIAQTGIGTTTPNPSAKLDVFATNKGFLPPRVILSSTTDATTIASPAEGLLVYNLGSVGLQAGYYYWNGANWATIATATSAGNGVTAMDMVKLYSGAWTNGTNTPENSSGYSFTVPVSGRYLFDFSSSGYLNQASMTFTFKVRQGTVDLATDALTSANNNVHVLFTGMLEVNLQAGVTYNVYVASTGSRDGGDWNRIFYKMIAGNLPVTGQSVDYVSVNRTTLQTVNTGDNIVFNTVNSGNIPYNSSTGNFTLTAGKTYRLTGSVSLDGSNTGSSEIDIAWKNAAGDVLGNRALILSTNYSTAATGNGITDIIYTPTVNTTISLNVVFATINAKTVPNFTYATVEQIGSSAIVNPWTLSGTNTYNTNGNVGIGTNAPNTSAILDLSSTTQGLLPPRMSSVQKSAISNVAGLTIYQTDGNSGTYYNDGSSWQLISNANYGDIKTGIQTGDHNGWIKLNGRAKSTLTSTQQAQATALGIVTNIPDATNAFLVQNSSTLGSVSGSNSKPISQSNLPNINFTGQIAELAHGAYIGASASGVFTRSVGSSTGNAGGGGSTETFNLNIPLNGGVTQTSFDITPKSLSVNTFIYLGF